MRIRETDHTTYALFPTIYEREMRAVFDRQGLEYKILKKDEFPEGVEYALELEGHILRQCLYCVESRMLPEDVHALVLKLWHPHKYVEAGAEPQSRE